MSGYDSFVVNQFLHSHISSLLHSLTPISIHQTPTLSSPLLPPFPHIRSPPEKFTSFPLSPLLYLYIPIYTPPFYPSYKYPKHTKTTKKMPQRGHVLPYTQKRKKERKHRSISGEALLDVDLGSFDCRFCHALHGK